MIARITHVNEDGSGVLTVGYGQEYVDLDVTYEQASRILSMELEEIMNGDTDTAE